MNIKDRGSVRIEDEVTVNIKDRRSESVRIEDEVVMDIKDLGLESVRIEDH